MKGQSVKRVVIAGGGTAGWLAGAALSRLLGPLLDITLVESDQIGTVGVGEATVPTMRTFHHLLNIDERDFMRATQSTFKLGIAFENWARIGDRYIHSFGQLGKSNWMGDFHQIWLEAREQGLAGDINEYCFEHQAAEAGTFATSDKIPINFAYHLDAGLYAKFLRALAEQYGIKRVEGRIQEVRQHGETGFITALALDNGDVIHGDLFIDCTGFRGLLIEGALKTGYEDWTHWLGTDSALAVQTRSTGPAIPYTRAIAHDAGWRWRIPLQHRVGNGLVFSSAHLSDDEAHARLLASIEGEAITEPKLIRYTTGRRRKAWNRNCVTLGLSSGFVEPLESTSIHLIQTGITRLIQNFPFSGVTEALAEKFNAEAQYELEHVRDFIIAHYKLTERDDSAFWRGCRDLDIPDSLAERITLFREHAKAWKMQNELFQVDSWLQVMLGQRLMPEGRHHMGRLMSRDQLAGIMSQMSANIARAVAQLPAHQDFVDSYCPAGEPG